MKILMNKLKIFFLVLLVSQISQAKLAQPDFVLYGTATWFGGTLPNGSEISIHLENQLVTVAKYSMGQDSNLNDLYALRVPMDDIDPRTFGKARPGDPAAVFINGNLVAEILIGDYGVAERLDIDPINLAGNVPIINISSEDVLEGNSGSSLIAMQVSLSMESDEEVSVTWTTNDGTAYSDDACSFDVDYVSANGVLSIPPQSLTGSIEIEVCGDTVIENSETFDVILTQANNAVIQFDRGTTTILDDDGFPELTGYDMVVFEPQGSSLVREVEFRLSRVYEQNISFDFTTVSGTAVSGLDYVQTSGFVEIPAGQQEIAIPIEFLADGLTENIEVMSLQISNVTNAQAVSDTVSIFILDSSQKQETIHNETDVDNNTFPELLSPSDVHFSSDNEHLYVASLDGGGSLLHFSFDEGVLNLVNSYENTESGFENTMFNLIRQIGITPDDKFLYAAASGNDAISQFSLDSNTGAVSFIGNITETYAGEFGIKEVYGLVISPDGNHLYAAGSDSDSVAVFSIDVNTGVLTFIEAEVLGVNDPDDAGGTVAFMDRPLRVDISPDGLNLYVAAEFSSSIAVFDRDVSTGEISYKQSVKSGVDGVINMLSTSSVNVSSDGSHVYATGRSDDSIVAFDRNSSGLLSFKFSMTKDNQDFIGLDGPNAIIENPVDSNIYAIGFNDSTLVSFVREFLSPSINFGDLKFADFEQDGFDGVDNMNGPTSLAITSNGEWIVVAAGIDNALSVFNVPMNDLIYKNGFEQQVINLKK